MDHYIEKHFKHIFNNSKNSHKINLNEVGKSYSYPYTTKEIENIKNTYLETPPNDLSTIKADTFSLVSPVFSSLTGV